MTIQPVLFDAFEKQAEICRQLGSPFYGELMELCAIDVAKRDGPIYRLLAEWPGDPLRDALPLRLAGAVHALVVAGDAPELAGDYPSAGGRPSFPGTWNSFRALVDRRRVRLTELLEVPPQTNEVGRTAGLVGGFLEVAAATELPLRVLELGSSGGLLMLWFLYRYELGPHPWGDERSRVVVRTQWRGHPPPLDAPVRVVYRRGCDLHPVNVADDEQCVRLESFVWADQLDRFALLRAAIDVAREEAPPIDAEPAHSWLRHQLIVEQFYGAATVVFHSVVWAYLSDAEQSAIVELLEQVGESATEIDPLAWLRLEDPPSGPGAGYFEVRLRSWPGGGDRLLAAVDPHGQWVEWF